MSSQAEPLLQHVRALASAQAPDDDLLAEYLACRDETAFAALVGRHGPMVFNLCRRILRDSHAAEDVFQATFLLLAERGDTIRRRASLACWLHGVAYRLAVRARKRASSAQPSGDLAHCDFPAPTPADDLAWREMVDVLDEELQQLPDHYRAPLVLCYLQGRTQDEAAQQLTWSVGTLRRRLDQGRALLEARLRGRGISLSAALAGLLAAGTVALPAPLQAAATAMATQGGLVMSRSVKAFLMLLVCWIGVGAALWIQGRRTGEDDQEPGLKAGAPPLAEGEMRKRHTEVVRSATGAVEACGEVTMSFVMLMELGVQEAKRGNAATAKKRFQQAADKLASWEEYRRASGTILLAIRLADAGDRVAAEALLVEGRRLASALKEANSRSDLVRFATVSLAEKIDRAKALTWAEKIADENTRLNAYRGIAVAQAEAGDLAGARCSIDLIRTKYGYFRLEPYKALVAAELKAGETKSAQATLNKALEAVEQERKNAWGDWRQTQFHVFLSYAVAQARAGDRVGARATFGRVEKEMRADIRPDSLGNLAALARAQADAGERAAARRTIGRYVKVVEDNEYEKTALAPIIPAQIALKDLDGPLKTARQVRTQQVIEQVCEALAEAGRHTDAVTLAREQKSATDRAMALLAVARGSGKSLPASSLPRYSGTLNPKIPPRSAAAKPPAQTAPDPAQQKHAIIAKWEKEWEQFNDRLGKAKTAKEREKLLEQERPSGEACARDLLALARKHPGKPVAMEVLSWIVEYTDGTAAAQQALALLRHDYLTTRMIADCCTLAVHGRHREEIEALLRAVLAKSPYRVAKGQACSGLAEFLRDQAARARFVQRLAAKDFTEYEGVYGQVEFRRLRSADPAALDREAEKLYERVVAEFANVFPSRATEPLGKRAQRCLDEIRLLAIGRTAPEIKGEDIDGKALKLSDHRGKVVVLVFWATWCGPCVRMIPHERELVKRLKDKPFVLLGINGDRDRAVLRRWLVKNPLPWRSWWDGRNENDDSGPIARAWNVSSWPTVYVLDRRGVIRHRDVHGKDLDKAVDDLLKETEQGQGGRK
jgi:RNA polymerase sigma factor (sigma-70 family)